jgi:septum formation protein
MLVLASRSPRRREILQWAGIPFAVRPGEVDETPLPGEAARDYVTRIARDKAGAVPAGNGEIVLGADTTAKSWANRWTPPTRGGCCTCFPESGTQC